MSNGISYDQMALVNALAFTRPSGTPENRKAIEIICKEIEKIGGKPVVEPFSFEWHKIEKAYLKVTKPYQKELPVKAVAYTGSLPKGGKTFDFAYAERGIQFDLDGKNGKAVLINNLDGKAYKALSESDTPFFLTVSGKYYDAPSVPVYEKKLPKPLRDFRSVPGLVISTANAIEMINSKATEIFAELEQSLCTIETANVIAKIEGTEFPDEIITYSAHFDSTFHSTGAYDNATGVSAIMALYDYFMKHPPKRTMVFVFCAAEENGLLGSDNFVKSHPEIIEKTRLEINFDLIGCAIGYNGVSYTAGEEVGDYLRNLSVELRHSLANDCSAAPSDSTNFARENIPSLNFYRYGEGEIHNINDIPGLLDPDSLGVTTDFVRVFAERVANAEKFPFERHLPDAVFNKVCDYLHRPRRGTGTEK